MLRLLGISGCRDDPAVIVADWFMPNGDAQYLRPKLRTSAPCSAMVRGSGGAAVKKAAVMSSGLPGSK
jgi:hypothetical protein